MADYSELKRLAEAATPGPWYAENERYEGAINAEYRHIGMVSMHANVREDIPQNFANQAFIAAANPAAVLAMLSENERLDGCCKAMASDMGKLTRERNSFRSKAEKLSAEIEALRKGLAECATSLEGEMLQKYGGQKLEDMHPVTRRDYDRDMAELAGYRAALSKGDQP